MEFFGLTAYGVSDPIKDMMRPDYQEPTEPPKDIYLGKTCTCPFLPLLVYIFRRFKRQLLRKN